MQCYMDSYSIAKDSLLWRNEQLAKITIRKAPKESQGSFFFKFIYSINSFQKLQGLFWRRLQGKSKTQEGK